MKPVLLVGATALALVLSACAPESSQSISEAIRPVRTVSVAETHGTDTVAYTGEILPRSQTDLGFKMGGRLIERLVETGDIVEPGDVLARIERLDFENQLRSSEAEYANALAGMETAEASLARQSTLLASGLITRSQMDGAQLEFNAANARLASAEASLNIVRENLEQTELRASTAGIVTETQANAGQMVAAGQAVVIIASQEKRDAAFDIPEQLIGMIAPGASVRVSLLSNPEVSHMSRVREISPMADATTRTYRILVDLTGATDAMILGAAVTGSLELGAEKVFRLPASAMTSAEGSPAVYVVNPESKELERRLVSLSQQTASQVIVDEGLTAGDLVVVAGVSKLRPGQTVRLEEGGK